MIGNILLDSQWVEFYQAETLYLGGSLASCGMHKSMDDQALENMRANLEALKKEKSLTNPLLAKKAQAATKTVNNLERGRHNVGVETVAAIAEALNVETWQLFIADLPSNPMERADLHRLVRAFTLLGEESRKILTGPVDALCLREDKLDQLRKDIAKHARTDRDSTKGPLPKPLLVK